MSATFSCSFRSWAVMDRGIVKLAVQEVFRRIHGLGHQHFEAAHGHRHTRLLGAQDQFRFVRIVDHIEDGFQPRHRGHIQIADPHVRVHARRGGVDDNVGPAVDGFRIGKLALFGVRMPTDGQHSGRALIFCHSARGVVGAAGAQNENGPARELHAVGIGQVGKAVARGSMNEQYSMTSRLYGMVTLIALKARRVRKARASSSVGSGHRSYR